MKMKAATANDIVALRAWLIANAMAKFKMQRERAEDAAHDAIVLGIINLGRYDAKQGQLRQWLLVIMLNKMKSGWRKSNREVSGEMADDVLMALVDEHPSPERALQIRQTVDLINDEMHNPVTGPLISGIMDDKTYVEMAADLNIPVGTIRSRISRMRDRLEGEL